jgi:hypothetical protein
MPSKKCTRKLRKNATLKIVDGKCWRWPRRICFCAQILEWNSIECGFTRVYVPYAPFPLDFSLLRLKVGFNKPAFTPSTVSSAEPSRQMMWHGLKVEVLSLKHRPSHRCPNMRQEYRIFKSVTSCPCDWLHFSLSYEDMKSFINKN